MATLDVQSEPTPRGLVVRLTGEAGADQVNYLDRELHALALLQPKLAVLDVARVPYISSLAIGSILRFRQEVAQTGGRVVIAALQPAVAETFRLENLERVLPTFATVDDALGASA